MIEVIDAIVRAETIEEIIHATMEVIRRRFGWTYGSYWSVDREREVLVFAMESGEVDSEFHRATRSAQFREGEGLNGRAWQRQDLVHVCDLAELADAAGHRSPNVPESVPASPCRSSKRERSSARWISLPRS